MCRFSWIERDILGVSGERHYYDPVLDYARYVAVDLPE